MPFTVRVKRGPSFTIPENGETIVLLPKKKEWNYEITYWWNKKFGDDD